MQHPPPAYCGHACTGTSIVKGGVCGTAKGVQEELEEREQVSEKAHRERVGRGAVRRSRQARAGPRAGARARPAIRDAAGMGVWLWGAKG